MQQGTPGNLSNFPGNGQGSFISLELEPYMLEAYFGKDFRVDVSFLGVAWITNNLDFDVFFSFWGSLYCKYSEKMSPTAP